ncbi:hypothetical protein DXG01_006706, partial [Tephrocybe rancida]
SAEWNNEIEVEGLSSPTTWKLLKKGSPGDPAKEVIFTVHGVIAGKDLPPVTEAPPTGKIRYLKQSVKPVSLGTDTFADAARGVDTIREFFDRTFPEGQLQDGDTGFDEPRIDTMNWYFVALDSVAPWEENCPFQQGVDPLEVLGSLRKKGYIHTGDNVVEYMEYKQGEGGKKL